jgi:hypothetical protein
MPLDVLRRWRTAAFLGGVALSVLVLSAIAEGGKEQPLSFANATTGGASNVVIEQQNDWPFPPDPIVNSLPGCTWDINDYLTLTTRGYLAPGAIVTKNVCMVSDYNPVYKTVNGMTTWWGSSRGHYGAAISAPSPDLNVTVCYAPQARCFHPSPVWDANAREYDWALCSQVVYVPDDPELVDIAGSNGGRGVVTTITFTLENPTARQVKGVSAGVGVASGAGLQNPPVTPGCPWPLPEKTYDYPFSWVL